MSYIYVYQIKTSTGTVIKVGHGSTKPTTRMKDYTNRYELEVDISSLKYASISDSKAAEKYVHAELVKYGYRNIRDGKYGPQEIFQAPKGTSYKVAAKLVIKLSNTWVKENPHIDYKASDLIGGERSLRSENGASWQFNWIYQVYSFIKLSIILTIYSIVKHSVRFAMKLLRSILPVAIVILLFISWVLLIQQNGFVVGGLISLDLTLIIHKIGIRLKFWQ